VCVKSDQAFVTEREAAAVPFGARRRPGRHTKICDRLSALVGFLPDAGAVEAYPPLGAITCDAPEPHRNLAAAWHDCFGSHGMSGTSFRIGSRFMAVRKRGVLVPGPAIADPDGPQSLTERRGHLRAGQQVEAHAVSLLRLAMVMTGDRPTAEDVVQDAFLGPQRRWDHLSHTDSALRYLRSSVLNGCRSVFRRRGRQADRSGEGTAGASAESAAILGEEHREVLSALRRLPPRQRQVLTLRFYLELPIPEIARTMGISQGTVKSTTSRALAALGRLLREDQ
jgi:RNA polymerase sigma-70 factor (sigma-E family)